MIITLNYNNKFKLPVMALTAGPKNLNQHQRVEFKDEIQRLQFTVSHDF